MPHTITHRDREIVPVLDTVARLGKIAIDAPGRLGTEQVARCAGWEPRLLT